MTHYGLHTESGSLPDAGPVIQSVISDLQSQNWSDLYDLLSSSETATISEAQFAQGLSSQQVPNVTSVSTAGAGTPSMNDGYQYFTQPVTLTVSSGGSASSYSSSIVLVLEGSSWRLLDTTNPVLSS